MISTPRFHGFAAALAVLSAAIFVRVDAQTITQGQVLNGAAEIGNITVGSNVTFTAGNGTTFGSGTTSFGGNDTINVNAGALSVLSTGTWSAAGNINLYGQSAGVSFTNNGAINTVGGWFSGENNVMQLQNAGTITNTNSTLTFGYYGPDSVSNSGTMTASSTNGAGAAIDLGGSSVSNTSTGQLSAVTSGNGNSTVSFGNGASNVALTNAGAISATVTGGGGGAVANVDVGGSGGTFANTGSLTASGTNAVVNLATNSSNAWTNTGGTISAMNGGTVNLEGAYTTASLTAGTINGTGGTLNLKGTLTNTGTLMGPDGGGVFTLYGGTISGGTVDGGNGALVFSNNGGTLNNVALINNFNIGSSTTFILAGTSAFTGSVTFAGSNSVNLATAGTETIGQGQTWTSNDLNLYAQTSGVTIANNGTMTFNNGGWVSGENNANFLIQNAGTLTNTNGSLQLGYYTGDSLSNSGTLTASAASGINSAINIGGSNNTIANTSTGQIGATATGNGNAALYFGSGSTSTITNSGSITASAPNSASALVAIAYGGNGSTFTNTGTISGNGANATIDLANNNNTWDNSGGTITLANGATLNLGGDFGTGNLGKIYGANGTVNLTGTLTNTGTLAGPTTGVFNLHGGTISGGTVDGALNVLQFTNSGGTLNNVAMINNFTVGQNAGFSMAGTTSFSGNVTLGGNNNINLDTTTLTIGSTAAWTDSRTLNLYAQTAGVTIANQGSIATNGGWFSGQNNGNFLINNSGTITNSGGNNLQLGYYAGDSLTNSGTILNTTSTNASPSLNIGGSNNTVTNSGLIESQATGSGNSQVFVANGSNSTLTNTGTLEATGANAYLTVSANSSGDTWTNTGGTIEALNGGTVYLAGSFTTATLAGGHILGAGGTLNLTGALNNAGATLAAPTSGIYTLDGGSIAGGTVDGSLNALQFSNSNGTLNNVSLINNFNIAQTTTFSVAGTTSFSGNVTLGGNNNINLDTTTPFTIASTSAWTDSGALNFYAQTSGVSIVNQGGITTNGGWMSGQNNGNFLINNSGTITNNGGNNLQLGYYNGDSLTNSGTILNTTSTNASPTLSIGGSNNTVTNSGLIESQATGSGASQVYVSSGTSSALHNTGTLEATGANAYLTVGANNTANSWTNTGGTIEALNGATVYLAGGFSTATLEAGQILGGAGTLDLTGTLNNNAATLAAPTSGIYTLDGGTITGGTVDGTLNALQFSNSNGTLNNVSMVNNFTIGQTTTFTVAGTTSFSGNVTLGGNNNINLDTTTLTIGSTAAWTDSGTLNLYAQTAGVTIANQGSIATNGGWFSGQNNGNFLINNSGTITNSGGNNLQLGYYAGDSLTNSGTILNTTSTNASPSLNIGGSNNTVTNSGLIESQATGSGNSQVFVANGSNSTLTNTGTLEATGANAYLTVSANSSGDTWTNTGGTIEALNGGAVYLAGSFTTATLAGGHILGAGGTLNLTGALNNAGATLAAPTSGIYTLDGGSIAGGTVDGSLNALQFSNSNGTLNNVSLINNFNIAQTTTFSVAGTTSFSGNVTLGGNNNINLDTTTPFTIASTSAWTDSGALNLYAQTSGATIANQGSITTNGGWMGGQGNGNFLINNSGTITNNGNNNLQLGYYNGDSLTNSGTITNQGSGNAAPSVTIGGSNNTIKNSGTMQTIMNGTNAATLTVGNGNNTSITNTATGIMMATNSGSAGASDLVIASGSGVTFTNQGTVGANGVGANAYVYSTTNLAGGTLTGGTWSVSNGGTLQFSGGPITTNAATLDIDGAGSVIKTSGGGQTLQQTLTTNNGTLSLDPVTFANSNALTNNGAIQLAGATLSAPSLTNTATGTITGNGTVNVQVANQGSVTAAGGTLTMGNGIVGAAGTVQVNNAATLSLAGGSTASTAGTLTDNGNLALGANNITVSNSYTNVNFGTGNSFNARAGVTGTGQILAAGNTAQTITGSAVSNGASGAPTLTLANLRVGGTQTVNYGVENSGTTGPSFVGAIQTDVNGGNITDGRLSGSGVTAGNFGPLASGQSQSLSVTETGTTAGALAAGQTVEVVSNFANVGPQTLALSGGAVYQPAEANTLANVNVGNYHVGAAPSSSALTITNIAPDTSGYTETLGASVTGSTGPASGTGSVTGLSFGQSSNGISVSLNTQSAGVVSGTATVDFQTQAINNSGLGTLDLGSQTVAVSGTGYQLAQATVQPTSPIALGNSRIGGSLSQNLTVTNSAPDTGGFTETLSGNVSGNGGSATSAGSFSGVGAGASSSAVNVSLATNAAGQVSGSTTLALASNAINNSGLGTTQLQSQTVSLSGTVYQAAVGSVTNGLPISLGNYHVGDAASTDLTINNVAPNTNGYTENLGATVSGTTGQATGSGSVTGLAQGASNSSGITVGLNTGTAGNLSGSATVGFQTQAIDNSGLGTANVGTQTVDLTGTAYALAQASVQPTSPISLGNTRLGGTLSQDLTVTNAGASTGGFTETLSGNVSGNSGSATSAGSIAGVAQGASNGNGIAVSLSTAAAGQISGSTTLAFNSNAIDNSGLGTTQLASQTVNLTGAVYQPAEANTLSNVNLGNFHVGASESQSVAIQNVASGPVNYTETLGANVGATSGAATAAGSVTGLGQGAASNGITVGLDTQTAGNLAGTATVDFQTQAVNNSGLGVASLGSQTINVTGTGYALAQASVQPTSPISLGNTRLGGTLSQDLTVTNSGASTGGFTENLSGNVSGNSGSATSAGSIAGVGQGASNGNGIAVSLSTAAAGQVSGSTTLAFNSNAIDNSGLGTTQLASQTVNLTGAVYQPAEANTLSNVNLGNFHVGDTVSQSVAVQNIASGPTNYTETLGANVGGTSGAATASGSVTGLGQGAASNGITVGLNTQTAGNLSGTATVDFQTQAVNNSGLGVASLGAQTINVTGTGYALAQASVQPASPISLGNTRIGGTLSQDLTVTNAGASTGGFTETLSGSVGGNSGSATSAGSFANVAQGAANNNGIAVSLSTAAAGQVSGSTTLALNSNAIDNSGLGTTQLANQTVNLTGAVYQAAAGQVSNGPTINLGNVHVGAAASAALTIANVAPNTGGYTENLGATVTGTSGSASASGSVTGLAQGANNSSGITVGLNTGTAGALSGTATVGFQTQAINNSGLGTASVGSQTLTVQGAAYNLAAGSVDAIDFGRVLQNSAAAQFLNVTNTAPTGQYSEGLDATIGGFTGASAGLLAGSGSITNLAAGQTSSNGLEVALNTSNTGTVSAEVQVNLASDGATTSHLGITQLPQQSAGVSGEIYVEAQVGSLASASAAAPNPVNLGNVRVGTASPTQALTLSNTATGPAEGLNASISTSSSGLTANGSFSSLQAGDTDSSSLVVGMNTASAGLKNGTATIALASDGSYNSGVTTSLGTQTVDVTGAVYQSAQAATLPTTVTLGNFHVGDTASGALDISNVAADTGGYTENLGASVTGSTGQATAAGSVSGLQQGGSSSAITVGLNTGTAGALSGTATVDFQTQAINNSGLGTADVGSQTVNVQGAAYQLAQANTQPTQVNLGASRIGGALSQNLNVSNAAPNTNGYTENLGGSASGNGSGSFTGLAQGQGTNALTVNLSTAQAGAVSGAANLSFESEAINNSGLGTTALSGQTVDLSGTVYQSAQAAALPTTVTLGNFHVGDAASGALTISNVAPNTNGYTENLGASVTGSTGQATTAGSVSGLQQGGSSSAITVGLNTGTAGALAGTATIDFQTQAINGSGLGTADVGSQTVNVQGAAYQLAQATTQPTQVNLGAARIGGALSQNLNVSNAAPNTNGYTENLGGSASGNGSGSFTGLAQGQGTHALSVSLSTAQAGAVSGAANLSFESEAINNSGLGTTALAGQTVNLTGAVYQTAEASALPSTVNLGTLRVGSSVTTALAIGNDAPDTQGYTETLGAAFGPVSSGLTASGDITGLAQGGSSNAMSVGFTAGQAGDYLGSANVDFDSEAIDNSGLGDLDLGSQTVQFSATVNAVADAKVGESGGAFAFSQTGDDSGVLNFGDLTEGQGDVDAALFLENNVSGPADELLSLIDAAGLSGSPFAYLGASNFDLSAQQQGGFNVDFDTDGQTGRFEATLVFDDASHNDDQSDLSLAPFDLTIEGDILPVNNGGGHGVPDGASTLLLLGAALGAMAAGRRWVRVAL